MTRMILASGRIQICPLWFCAVKLWLRQKKGVQSQVGISSVDFMQHTRLKCGAGCNLFKKTVCCMIRRMVLQTKVHLFCRTRNQRYGWHNLIGQDAIFPHFKTTNPAGGSKSKEIKPINTTNNLFTKIRKWMDQKKCIDTTGACIYK